MMGYYGGNYLLPRCLADGENCRLLELPSALADGQKALSLK